MLEDDMSNDLTAKRTLRILKTGRYAEHKNRTPKYTSNISNGGYCLNDLNDLNERSINNASLDNDKLVLLYEISRRQA